jgi:hypothetical protein
MKSHEDTRMNRSLPLTISLPLAITAIVLATAAPASAQETGIHKMHDVARVGGKLCMTSHEHYGESPPVAAPNAGRTLAIHKWQMFTADEYGKAWGIYANAVGKKEKCVGTAPNLICSVEARPCRSGR